MHDSRLPFCSHYGAAHVHVSFVKSLNLPHVSSRLALTLFSHATQRHHSGGFPEVSAVILYTSALAAIMSTTDSVLISISQIITSDILYPMRPNATPKQVAWAGRIVSLVVSILALALGLLWKGSIILLFDLSLPISVQMVPAFLIGLYSKYRPHPWSLAIPTWGGMLASILITIWWEHDSLHDAVFVFLLNFGAMLLCELGRLMWNRKLRFNMAVLRNLHNTKAKAKSLDLDDDEEDHQDPYPNRPEWDKPKVKRFGVNSLSPKLLEAMMLGMQEPIKNYQYVLLMLLSVSITGKSAFVLFYHVNACVYIEASVSGYFI